MSDLDDQASLTNDRLADAFGLATRRPGGASGAVSIGIEIETTFSSHFPQLWTKYGLTKRRMSELSRDEHRALSAECSVLEVDLLPRLRLSEQCGVPRGNDRYWEFAFRPAHDVGLLVEQVRLLSAAGLLPRNRKQSLQVTIGGIPPCRSLYYLAMILELQCVDPQRILVGMDETRRDVRTGWAARGRSGIRVKGPADLEGGCQVASEIRMLQLPTDQAEFGRLMATASWGANALQDIRRGTATPAARDWTAVEAHAVGALERHGLPACNWAEGGGSASGVAAVGQGGGIRYDAWERFASAMGSIRNDLRSAIGNAVTTPAFP